MLDIFSFQPSRKMSILEALLFIYVNVRVVCCRLTSYIYNFHFAVPMIQNLETTLRSGGVPQVPQFRPSTTVNPLHTAAATTGKKTSISTNSSTSSTTREVDNEVKGKDDNSKTEGEPQKSSPNVVNGDPLGDARSKVQDEIIKEFAAIMATGTMRASEAAALATKRVMQRYGHTAVSQS